MNQQIFFQIVAPLMGVSGTAVLAISTPDDEFGYYSELLNLGIFREIYLGKECDACSNAGIACTHRKLSLPPWKSMADQSKIEKMIKDQALLDRETRGIINTNKDFLFKKPWIRALLTRPAYQFQFNCQVLHTAIDPAGGGEGSDYTIGTMAHEDSRKVVSFFYCYNSANASTMRRTNTPVLAISRSSVGLYMAPSARSPSRCMSKPVCSTSCQRWYRC